MVGIDGAVLAGDETWTLSGNYGDPDHADAATQAYQYAKYVSAGDSPVEAYLDLKGRSDCWDCGSWCSRGVASEDDI